MSEEGNVALPAVTPTDTIEVHGGDSAVSFDELESVGVLDKKGKSSPKKEAQQKEPKEVEYGEEKSEESEKGSKEKLLTKTKKAEEKEEPVSPPVKTLKLKNGDTDVEIRADALVDVKVDGKIQKIPLQEAINNYSGSKHLREQADNLQREQQTFSKQKSDLSEAITHVHSLITGEDPRSAVYYLSEMMGQSGDEIWNKLVEDTRAMVESYSQLSPEERRLKEIEEENKFLRTREQRAVESQKRSAEMQKIDAHVKSVQQQHGIDDESFISTYDEMVEYAKRAGRDPGRIGPEDVAGFYKFKVLSNQTREILKQVNSNPDTFDKDVATLRDLAQKNPDLSTEDLRQIALEIFGNDSAKRLSKKIKKMESQTERKATKDPRNDPVFFDELGG